MWLPNGYVGSATVGQYGAKPDSWYIRGFILDVAEMRPSEELLHCPGDPELECPVGDKVAAQMEMSKAVLSRILDGRCDSRSQQPYRASPELLEGLRKYARLSSVSDVTRGLEKAEPLPPFQPRLSRAAHMKRQFKSS